MMKKYLYQKYGFATLKDVTYKARKEHYAVVATNVISLSYIYACLKAAKQANSAIILAVTSSAMKGIGDAKAFARICAEAIRVMDMKTPVVVHLDHGKYEAAIEAIKAGFSSVMFDGSALPFKENIKKTKYIVELAKKYGCSTEAEVGPIGGKEDNAVGAEGEMADVDECVKVSKLGIDCLAAGIGNIHGVYPKNWNGINLELLKEIHAKTGSMPLVLHGGSGIPNDQVKAAIKLGVCKFNVGTETLIAYSTALNKYFKQDYDKVAKNYDPRKYLEPCWEAVVQKVIEKMALCGSLGKAKK